MARTTPGHRHSEPEMKRLSRANKKKKMMFVAKHRKCEKRLPSQTIKEKGHWKISWNIATMQHYRFFWPHQNQTGKLRIRIFGIQRETEYTKYNLFINLVSLRVKRTSRHLLVRKDCLSSQT